jgi:hypothetical protein
MTKFLSVLGKIIKIVGIAAGFIPLVNTLLPAAATGTATLVEDKLQKVVNVVITAEQMFAAAYGPNAKMGSDKLKAATPFVAQIIQQTDLLIGKKPKNEQLFEDASTRLTAALADILNAFEVQG